MALHVSLSEGLEKRVHNEVAKGLYGTASEVVSEALQQFFATHEEPAWIAPEMRRRAEAMDRGEYEGKMIDGELFLAQIRQKYP